MPKTLTAALLERGTQLGLSEMTSISAAKRPCFSFLIAVGLTLPATVDNTLAEIISTLTINGVSDWGDPIRAHKFRANWSQHHKQNRPSRVVVNLREFVSRFWLEPDKVG